ncbi:transposase [Candidatus Paracaedimonas acanthamoebae]|nr:transposase [Candidatus Paracaedimonas acanthamoebae]
MYKYYIKPEAWSKIYEILKRMRQIRVKNETKTRRFFEGIYYIMRTGSQWRELPTYYGKWRSVHKRYAVWCCKDFWNFILQYLTPDKDGENHVLDASIVRAHPCAAGYKKGSQEEQALGRSKGGFTTKIHVVVDALGQALRFSLTGGHRHDITQAPYLVEGMKNSNIIADKAYDSNTFIEQIKRQSCTPVIPPRASRKEPREYDEHLYKERHLIECFFNKIKYFRRVFSRFDKKASSFMGFLAYASTILWLR